MSENTFTQEQVDEMIKERIAREKKKFESEKKELERKHGETIEEYETRINNANLTAEEKYTKSIAELQNNLILQIQNLQHYFLFNRNILYYKYLFTSLYKK